MERKLKDVCDFYVGTGFPVKYQGKDNGELPFYKVGDIANNVNTRNVYLTLCNNYISKEEAKELKGKIVPPKTVVFAKIGEALKLNRRAITSQDCLIDNNVMGIAPRENELNLSYFFYYMKYLKMELLSESTAVPSVRKSILEDAMIKVPSINVQAKTGKILDSLNEIIQLRKQQLTEYDQLIKSRFVEMFGDPETNPFGWEKAMIADVCSSIVRGPFGSALKKDYFVEKSEATFKVYEQKHAIRKSATIGSYYISKEKFNELKRFECSGGDILMSCSGTMGELYQLPDDCEPGIINQALLKFTLNHKIKSIVFLIYMQQIIGNLETKGSGIQNIAAVSTIKSMPINLPPMEIQKQFAKFIQQVDKLKLNIQKSLDETQILFDSLMQEYFG